MISFSKCKSCLLWFSLPAVIGGLEIYDNHISTGITETEFVEDETIRFSRPYNAFSRDSFLFDKAEGIRYSKLERYLISAYVKETIAIDLDRDGLVDVAIITSDGWFQESKEFRVPVDSDGNATFTGYFADLNDEFKTKLDKYEYVFGDSFTELRDLYLDRSS